jgi:hypothetical protein
VPLGRARSKVRILFGRQIEWYFSTPLSSLKYFYYLYYMSKEKVNCIQCKTVFEKRKSEIIRNPNHFCSRSCSAKFNNKNNPKKVKKAQLVNTTCGFCNKGIVRRKYELKNNTNNFCTRLCQRNYDYNEFIKNWLNGKESGNASGGASAWVKRYILEKCNNKCVACNTGNTWNGIPLILQLDHIDGDCKNNLELNLRILCPNCHTQTNTYGSKNKNSSRKNYK